MLICDKIVGREREKRGEGIIYPSPHPYYLHIKEKTIVLTKAGLCPVAEVLVRC